MKRHNLVLGFYQNQAIAEDVVAKLQKESYWRFAYLHHSRDGRILVQKFHPTSFQLILLFTLAVGLGFSLGISGFLTFFLAVTLFYLYYRIQHGIDYEQIVTYKHRMAVDESLIMVDVRFRDIRDVLKILREVKSGHPLTFLIRSTDVRMGMEAIDLPKIPLTSEQLGQSAQTLAETMGKVNLKYPEWKPLLKRLHKSEKILNYLRRDIEQAEHVEQTITRSAEWLLDNNYVIQGSIAVIQKNLPKSYYLQLPKIVSGPLKGFPRMYALAIDFVNGSIGKVVRENLIQYLSHFQKIEPLTIGELWVFPMMLRLRLIEWIQFLAVHVDRRMREGELASFWGNRLLHVAKGDPDELAALLEDIKREYPQPSSHFAEELLNHLFDEETVIPLVREWLEGCFGYSIVDILQEEHLQESSEQVAFSNAIVSLITLSQIDWKEIFESVSLVDAILNQDTSGFYARMDFATRNQYRNVVEHLGRHSGVSEIEIAHLAVKKTTAGMTEVDRHVGYYLLDKGLKEIESNIHYYPPFKLRVRGYIRRHATCLYLGTIALLTISFSIALGPVFLLLLPVSELVIQWLNFFLSKILPATTLPKLDYGGLIPEENKTLVVVPMMLSSAEVIEEELSNLEIRYLANTDPSLLFSLFSDFTDAPQKDLEKDKHLLEIAVSGIASLNQKYGEGKFFLFHRMRSFSKTENAWIGWERKRGKLEMLNRFLMGEALPENILYYGAKESLYGIRFVITLDADTQLPKDRAKMLIATLSHPLNRPYLASDGKSLSRGYTLIQPRIGSDISQITVSWFSRIFSDPSVMDPYTRAISNVYQDLTGEGAYLGKGIYDLRVFHTILSGRFPEEHLLSHDLVEGAFAGVGSASDISLLDTFPADFFSYAARNHRWMRGDLQIIEWVFSNSLSVMNRWKIFDNVRRLFVPLSLMALLLYSFFTPFALTGIALVLLIQFTPVLQSSELKRSFLRSLINLSLLPYETYSALDAFIRVVYRRFFSHRKLLEWTPYQFKANTKAHFNFILKLIVLSLFTIYISSVAPLIALPFCILWILSPLIVLFIDRPLDVRPNRRLYAEEQNYLRVIARKTWRYFDDLVGVHNHWMPPDNYQLGLKTEVAQRSSPTNMGLWLTGVVSAYDLQYITLDQVIEKISATMDQIKKLELFQGHLLNWYDIETLNPLYPRYISTVDSGNFIACLWTIHQAISEMLESPLFPHSLQGVEDSYAIYNREIPKIKALFSIPLNHPITAIATVKNALQIISEATEEDYWLTQMHKQLMEWEKILDRYWSWVEVLGRLSDEQLKLIDSRALIWKKEAENYPLTLKLLADGSFSRFIEPLINASQKENLTSEIRSWGRTLQESISRSQWYAGEKLGIAIRLLHDIQTCADGIDMGFLYNRDRKVFAIGYNVDDRRLDNCYYDLLASEARIASLVAIAKGDVPLEHWWSLGRPYTIVDNRRVLLSWAGTMFEYLMPLIFNKCNRETLLGDACSSVVKCQMDYGKKRGIPWGISESAFSEIDLYKTYQYRSFGVPGIGLKRGLERDLVVSPYSSGLALAVDPVQAIDNLKSLTPLMGPYGFYESIDYSRQSGPEGERGVIVYAYMAHHQGMILAAINNVLNDNTLVERFHIDPRIKGIESLLYEMVPKTAPVEVKETRNEKPLPRLLPFSPFPYLGVTDTPGTHMPKVNLLSNGQYSLMITNAGGGYSQWDDIEITRWRSDATRDLWGSYFYIKDVSSGKFWSAMYQPTQTLGDHYYSSFNVDKVEFKRRDNQIETNTEIIVSPEDNVEIRLVTLVNRSSVPRSIELTSYSELVLAPHAADRAHLCFNKMFIETEAFPENVALIAFRRSQSLFAFHVLAAFEPGEVQYETDREKFIGRCRTFRNPLALEGKLSNTTGTVLDPIFSLRRSFTIPPTGRIQVSFVTGVAKERDEALALIEKYKDFMASKRALDLAWNYAQLELRHLRIHLEDVQLFQQLAGRIIYPHEKFRASADTLNANRLGQKNLWPYGISGDLPILVVTVGDVYDIYLVKQVLIAHSFWRLRGLKVDLVIINEEVTGYEQPLFEQLKQMIQAFAYRGEINKPGGVFLLLQDKMESRDLNLILACASVVLVAARGSLRQQMVTPPLIVNYPAEFIPLKKVKEEPSRPLPFLELPYFNGLGGYSADGKNYSIYLGPRDVTPMPWINVIANPTFGTLVSESGIGTTWFGNSQSNRLTPWCNDPVKNQITDCIYIRDEDTGSLWTPTPAPIRELDAYRVTHGQGFSRFEHNSHGIEQDLLIFVPMNNNLRIQRLHLVNRTSQKKLLSVTAYSEWVLGTDREVTQKHIITDWDMPSQSLFAFNRYNPDYDSYVAFATSIPPAASYTGDRTEFIGRNGNLVQPAAMKRKALSRRTGTGLDPCASIQTFVSLEPGASAVVVFILGYAESSSAARIQIDQCRRFGMIDTYFSETESWWNQTLESLQVVTPDLAVNFACNRWLPYQNLSCRFMGRTAFYQSSGAFGFRDQLQDSLAMLYSHPEMTRAHIVKAASRQFEEGDVQHWWHEPSGAGIRTRISDDLLWLPFVTAQYVRVTGDTSILNQKIPFLKAPLLEESQHEVYGIPEISSDSETLLEHCRRAVKKGLTKGPHGLPLIGGGDWNDGMNRVGKEGKGESVWLGWFLIHVLHDFAEISGEEGYKEEAKALAARVEQSAWDGEWYRRAYYDDGTPIGSKDQKEAIIDSLAQSWAVICGAADPARTEKALRSAEEHLVKKEGNLVLLLTPPFDKTPLDPGYIKGYPPGVRENGGQYTHGSAWLAMAFARIGNGDKAVDLLRMMHPGTHTENLEQVRLYKGEPYVLAADVYDLKGQLGRAGWTWYSGSAGWFYRIWLEEVLGFKLRGNKLTIKPCIPKAWNGFTIKYRYFNTVYEIIVENPEHKNSGSSQVIDLVDDQKPHQGRIVL